MSKTLCFVLYHKPVGKVYYCVQALTEQSYADVQEIKE